jgi:hypothetical protein
MCDRNLWPDEATALALARSGTLLALHDLARRGGVRSGRPALPGSARIQRPNHRPPLLPSRQDIPRPRMRCPRALREILEHGVGDGAEQRHASLPDAGGSEQNLGRPRKVSSSDLAKDCGSRMGKRSG